MKKLLLPLVAGVLFLPMTTFAATFQGGDSPSINTEISDDLYVGGETVRIPANVNGDLLSVGGKIFVEGNVSQDVMAVGGEISISGEISDDVRAVGGTVRIESTIKGDLLAAGRNVTLNKISFVGGDVTLAAERIFLGGRINGDVLAYGREVHINSVITGSVKLMNSEKITFGPDAKILGSLTYKAREAVVVPNNVVGGETIFKQIEAAEKTQNNLPAIMAGFSLFSLLSTLFFGVFFIWLYRYFIINSIGRAYEATLKSLGVGFLVIVLTPIAILILLVTTIGAPLALISFLLWIITLYFAKIAAAMLIGFKIVKVDQKSSFGRIFGSFFLGALIYTLIGMIPVFGWILNFLFVLITLGGMTSYSIEVSKHLSTKKLC